MMKCVQRPKIIMVPYPAQGHVTPMLKLASAFLKRGLEPVVVTPEFIHRRIAPKLMDQRISCMSIPDGLEEAGRPRDFFTIEMAMENNMPLHLERLVLELLGDGQQLIICMVVDLLASWAINVANRCGVQVAGFWPVMLAAYQLIAAIPHMLRSGIISQTGHPQYEGPICLPNQPVLSTEDLPWLIGTWAARSSRFKFWRRTMDRSRSLRWLLVNSFPEEISLVDESENESENENENDDKEEDSPPLRILEVGDLPGAIWSNNGSFWEEDMSCLDWLDKQIGWVVYISFGSWVSSIGEGKVKSLALALEASKLPFIWVLPAGTAWRDGLPVGYLERVSVSQQGKVVSWAPQMEVLQHKAVGCYLTHCGWNSTLEAIQCKKPLLCYPLAGDQFLNCAYIVQVWRIGVRMTGFGHTDLEEGLKRVMDDCHLINHRLMALNHRIMGTSSAAANLTAFIHDLNKFHSTT
uniref:Glycosyltransferase n=1 Tax=Davidia involucrata TaxID=16924 RepID=A0A5B7CCJ8_DAVIN